jgi:hypothetical protein
MRALQPKLGTIGAPIIWHLPTVAWKLKIHSEIYILVYDDGAKAHLQRTKKKIRRRHMRSVRCAVLRGEGMTRRTLLAFANIARAWNTPFLGLRATRQEVAVGVFHSEY